ncbi:10713_t:CDS:2, partial [Gigaspora margarita]
MTKKPKDKDQNETKKQEEHGRANLNFLCETWMNKVNNLKRIVKNPYEQKYTERHKIVNIVQDAETLRKDKAQSIRSLLGLKSGYQELKEVTEKILEKHNKDKVLHFDAAQVGKHIRKFLPRWIGPFIIHTQ